jgi:uncharacterized protein involved in tellurium resistance
METLKRNCRDIIYQISSEISLHTDVYIARFSQRKGSGSYKGNWRQSIYRKKPFWEQIAWLFQFPENGVMNFHMNVLTKDPANMTGEAWEKLRAALENSCSADKIELSLSNADQNSYAAVNYSVPVDGDTPNEAAVQRVLKDIPTIAKLFVEFAGAKSLAGIQAKNIAATLTEPEASVKADFSNELSVRLRWFKDVDFDLAALYKLNNGNKGLVYFAGKGSLTDSPHILLDKDAMYGGDDNEKAETLRIQNNQHIEKVYLVCWDYTNRGGNSVFENSNVNISISDDKGNMVVVKPVTSSGHDAVCVAELTFESDGINIQNSSKSFKRPSTVPSEILALIS